MLERRKRIMKRLVMEELERRTMLDASFPAMAATGLTNNSYEDFYKAQVGTEIGGPAGVGMLAELSSAIPGVFVPVAGTVPTGSNSFEFNAGSGVGQMLLTTGANTLGISSFMTPTAGPSRAGGTGNAALGGTISVNTGATDQALQELLSELPALASMEGVKETADAEGRQAERAELKLKERAEAEQASARSERELQRMADELEDMLALAGAR